MINVTTEILYAYIDVRSSPKFVFVGGYVSFVKSKCSYSSQTDKGK